MIELISLRLKNFLSHRDSTINFKGYQGLVLIEGRTADSHYSSNGAGKSTVLEGIVYALTGNTLRGVGVADVVNRNANSDTCVSLTLAIADDMYEINRYRKDKEHGDNLVLIKNSEDISKRLNKDTQKILDDIIGISYNILVSTMLLGEGLSSRFTQLSDPEKKALIESTLNLSYDMNALRSQMTSKLSQCKLEKSNADGKLSILQGLLTLDADELQTILDSNASIVADTSQRLTELAEQESDTSTKIADSNTRLTTLSTAITNRANIQSQVDSTNDTISRLSHALEVKQSQELPHCDKCLQALSSAESLAAFTTHSLEEIAQYQQKLETLTSQLDALPLADVLQEKYNTICGDMAILQTTMREIRCAQDTAASKKNQASIDTQVAQNQLDRSLTASTEIETISTTTAHLDADMAKYSYFSDLFSPKGIVTDILSSAIEYLNTRLAVYSHILLDTDYTITFVKGKISLVDSAGSTYQSMSNGEKRRLDIAIQFSLHDYCTMYCDMKLDCCFIDEILDTLDDIGVENIFEVLRLKLDYCQLSGAYIITHNDTLKDKFDNYITVIKDEKGDSSIV